MSKDTYVIARPVNAQLEFYTSKRSPSRRWSKDRRDATLYEGLGTKTRYALNRIRNTAQRNGQSPEKIQLYRIHGTGGSLVKETEAIQRTKQTRPVTSEDIGGAISEVFTLSDEQLLEQLQDAAQTIQVHQARVGRALAQAKTIREELHRRLKSGKAK